MTDALRAEWGTVAPNANETKYPPRVIPEGTWQQNATKDGWFKTTPDGLAVIDAKAFAQWEKNSQRGLDGKDRFRGIKQKARFDMFVAEFNGAAGVATADATGTP